MDDHDDNIFVEDDALDYVLYEETEKDVRKKQIRLGCLGLIGINVLPITLIYFGVTLI